MSKLQTALTYPETFIQKIGFDSIVELLQSECITDSAAGLAARIVPITDFDKLKTYLEQTQEFKQVLMLEKTFPSQDYYDLSGELKRLRVEGTYITLEGLQKLRASYTTLSEIKKYFTLLDAETYPRLVAFSLHLEIDPDVLPRIDTILTRTGEVKDNASENLLRIRSLIRRKSSETQRYIGKYMTTAKQQGWVEDDADVTVRNERLVIPVAAAYKKSMRGFIHDVSSTGQTVFMEPEEIFNLNNEIVELRNEERLEIIEILRKFSAFLRPGLDHLLRAYRFLTATDFLRAKARLAMTLDAGLPILEKEPCFEWRQARHPLLFLTLKKQTGSGRQSEIVPLDLCLDPNEKIVIISGPNAGGKSVCLKTVGLLQYMLQCGLLVSMREDSRVGVFRNIFVDIGDEQSIENDLSTYSSHLKNMKFWVEHADRNTLFLSDELGSGTEPQVGGAIAESLIEQLLQKGARGIVTTHYTNLKLMAKSHPGIVNGAMLFDQENLRPLYMFRKGLPGSSFAFEIARKIGLPENLLASASRKVGRRQMNFEQELQQLEVEKHEVSRKKQEVELADELLASTLEKYNKLLAELEENRSRLMREAKAEAKEIVRRANAHIERTIREIREAQAEKEQTLRLRKVLQEKAEQGFPGQDVLTPAVTFPSVTETLPVSGFSNHGKRRESAPKETSVQDTSMSAGHVKPPLQTGSLVRLQNGGNAVARIGEIKGKQARIDFDYMSMQVPLSRLDPLTAAEVRHYEANSLKAQVKIENLNSGKENFRPYLDIRGFRAEEAQESVRKLLDDAVLYGEKYLEILHGKGNGVLRQLVRGVLAKSPQVVSYYDQREEMGGTGITIAELS